MRSGGQAQRILRLEGYAYLAAFILCIPLANWMVLNIGTKCVVNGPCLIPVWPGILSPSGVLVVGLAFTLRDMVQRRLGTRMAFFAVMGGAVLSGLVSTPALAAASTVAFLVSETADLAVYSVLARRSFVMAVFMSNIIGLLADSFLFLHIAFGSIQYMPGQAMGKLWMTIAVLPLICCLRVIDHRRGIGID